MSHSICVISTRAPYAGQFAREALDAVLVSASYDLDTHLLLMGDGVFQLLQGQNGTAISRKNMTSMLQALPLYGVDTIYVDEASLQERGFSETMLPEGVTVLKPDAVSSFIQQHSRVLKLLMNTLHTVNKTGQPMTLCLRAVSEGDAVLLLEDGVYDVLLPELQTQLKSKDVSLHALTSDALGRGITIPDGCHGINYDEFVELCCQHEKVITWF